VSVGPASLPRIPLPPFGLERYFTRYEFTARFLLCASDCESLPIRDLLAMEPGAAEALQRLRLGYTESAGSPTLRAEISGLYTDLPPVRVLVHAGAEEAIFLFMHAALAPGDQVVVHSPCYQSLAEVARSIGCTVTPWHADEANGWALDPDDLRRALTPAARAIVINTPHNPTGYLMDQDRFREVNRIALDRGIILFSDEVYRESEHDPADRLPPACDLNDLAVSLGVMSKTYGLAGLRIGWVASRNAEIVSRMARLKDYTTICTSAPSEFLAEVALRHREQIVRRNRDIIRENLAVLDAFFARHPRTFDWRRPRAGSIAFPRLVGGDVERFCHELVTEAGVLLLPGTLFEDAGNHFRVGFGRKDLPQAVTALEGFLAARTG
jgi:aspartate/methionine/tyrosine aminotransferase